MNTIYGYGTTGKAVCKIEIEEDQGLFHFRLSSRLDDTCPWVELPVGIRPGEDQEVSDLFSSLPIRTLEGAVSMAQSVAQGFVKEAFDTVTFLNADHLKVVS